LDTRRRCASHGVRIVRASCNWSVGWLVPWYLIVWFVCMRRHSARSCCSLTTNLQSTSPCLPEIMSSELANVHVLGAAAVASAVAASAAGHHPGEVNTQAVQSHLHKTENTCTCNQAARTHVQPIRGTIQEVPSNTRSHPRGRKSADEKTHKSGSCLPE